METENVCYTQEVALEKAIEMETKSFEAYRNAYFRIKESRTRDLLKDLALDELKHKYILEKALFEDAVMLDSSGKDEGPSMNLSIMLKEKPLSENSTDQDVMIFAIHEEKRAMDYYGKMAEQCTGAPMAEMFKELYKDEENHLARLETLYESVYMQEM
ncbi:MAG: ferritin family protein [Deltaproteobacteria bacterium]|nr:ferritin family protein [Deltaproteobacteria bacterium]